MPSELDQFNPVAAAFGAEDRELKYLATRVATAELRLMVQNLNLNWLN